MYRYVCLFVFATLGLCCGPVFAAAGNFNPPLRLPSWAEPEAYTLAFRIDPAKSSYAGVTTIDVDLKKSADHIWLHSKDITVSSVTVTDSAGHVRKASFVDVAPKVGEVRVNFGQMLKPQDIRLTFKFKASFNKNLQGLYKVVDNGRPYVMTQFAPISARYAFPCFDQLGFKTPFNVSMTIPMVDKGFANTKIVKKVDDGDGWKTLTFAQTQPLPTYLVAYAVGPWSVIKGPTIEPNKWQSKPIPLYGVAVAGQAKYMKWILAQEPAIIHSLEKYYAFGYPYGTLDLVAAPQLSYGAMENPGFITFRQSLLLLKPGATKVAHRKAFNVTAHESSHQWTGDTVTEGWWNDVWLSEGFAVWMQRKLTEKLHPSYGADVVRVKNTDHIMGVASLANAHKIRHTVKNTGDIETIYSQVTYQGGAAVIAMFENYVGEKAFRKGMRAYIRKYRFGSADAKDLVDSIAKAAGKGTRFKQAFLSFLNQHGVPDVTTKLHCHGNHPVLGLTQSRYLPLGSSARPNGIWGIPICARDGAGVNCQMLDTKKGRMTLAGSQCPTWYIPNANAIGYYRFSMAKADMRRLDVHFNQLSDTEKLAYTDAINGAFHRGEINAHQALAIIPKLASSRTAAVALAPLNIFGWIWQHEARTKAQKAKLTAIIKAAYLPRLKKLGYIRRKGESAGAASMRVTLARLLGLTLRLPEVRAALLKQGNAVLKIQPDGDLDLGAADSDLLGTVLAAEVQVHGKPVIDTLMQQLGRITNPAWRSAMLVGLEQAKGEQANRVRNFALGKDVNVDEMSRLLFVDRATPTARTASWDWFVKHYDQVVARLTSFGGGYLPRIGGGCSVAAANRARYFFTPKLQSLPGSSHALAQTIDSTLLCAALKKAQNPKAIME